MTGPARLAPTLRGRGWLFLALAALTASPAAAEDPPPPAPPADPPGFWREEELALLDRGLDVLNATRADMGFQKRPIEDPFRLAVVNRALDDPLSVGREAGAWDAVVRGGDPVAILERAEGLLAEGAGTFRQQSAKSAAATPVEHLPPEVAGAFRHLLALVLVDGDWVGRALPAPASAAAPLLRKALHSQVEKPVTPVDAPDLADDAFLDAARAIRPEFLHGPARGLLRAVADLVAALRGAAPEDPAWTGTHRFSDEFGDVVISGYGDDVHDEGDDAAVVIDLGGNDVWRRGASASILRNRPVSIRIDLAGDDRYVGRDDLSFGAALGGIAIQWDGGGDDFWDGGHASLGAGICGVGVLVDEGGDDVYRCRDFGIGAGAFGIGLLLDGGGNDLYHCDLYGEGFASTRGCGVLADLDGNDVYDAGGVHVHAPLYTDRYQSLSQGFSIGMRPDASGGVGVLVDVRGNDRYMADIYGQGASYWYALGILVDGDGNDTYNLGQYGQGSGIHLSAGILVDRAGSDLYYLKNGVGMGGAHDYAVGMLVDRGGDDYYAGSGGTQGGSLTNSVALLFDGGGNDGYAAVNPGGAQGGASMARGTGGIGLLLDAGGSDVHTEKQRDGATWTKELVGAGLDEPSPEAAGGSGDPGTTSMTEEAARAEVDRDGRVAGPDGTPVDDLERLWAVACRWEVGDQRVVVPVARERLVALGAPALARALERVGTKDGLEFRAVESTLGRFPADEVVPRLVERTREEDPAVRKGAVRALGTLRAGAALDRLGEMLEGDPPCRATVLSTLTALGSAPPAVKGLLLAEEERTAVAAVTCLAAAGGADHIDALAGALGPDHAFPVRLAALDRLAAQGEASLPALGRVAGDETAPLMARRNAVRALGRTRAAGAAAPVAAALGARDRMLRFSAFQAAAELQADLGPGAAADLALALATARAAEKDPLLLRLR